MGRALVRLIGIAATLAGVLSALEEARAQSCTLELKRLETQSPAVFGPGSDYIYRATYPQSFFMQTSETDGVRSASPSEAAFSRIVTKQPSEYHAEHPCRGVLNLGTREYAFVLDTQQPASQPGAEQPESKEPAPKAGTPLVYSRLYFDFNCNGDLTDDEVIEGKEQSRRISGSYGHSRLGFPRIDLTIDADGSKFEYSLFLQAYSYTSDQISYVSGSINAAAYRQGEITLDGKLRNVVLIDFNSNGRFDDEIRIRNEDMTPGGEVELEHGDVLLVDPDPSDPQAMFALYDLTRSVNRYPVSKLLCVDGRFYDVQVTPGGDNLTLTPSSAPLGCVSNPNAGFRAVVYGEKGWVKISGDKGKTAALPEGKWKLLAYTIDQTGYQAAAEPAKEEAKEKEEKKQGSSPLQALASALFGAAEATTSSFLTPHFTLVSAQATGDYEAVEVREGETVELPFGPPYKPVVAVSYRQGEENVLLGMSLIGSARERCTDLYVNGGRPKAAEFTIRTPSGEEVESGKFEYG